MSYKYDVSVIIINYNGKQYIDNLFQSLQKLILDSIKVEIIVVDNNSVDDSVQYLKEKYIFDNFKIIESKQNLGFAGGNNLGVSHAAGEYIIFLNNDTKVDKFWLKELLSKIKSDKTIGIVNSKLLFFYDFIKIKTVTQDKFNIESTIKINGQEYTVDNKWCKNLLYENQMTCFGHSCFYIPLILEQDEYEIILELEEFNNKTDYVVIGNESYYTQGNNFITIRLTLEEVELNKISLIQNAGSGVNKNYDGYDIGFCQEDEFKYNVEYEINNACGASFIISKEDFETAGKFDEKFFMYYEDTDLSYRIKKLGKRIVYYPNSIVRHIHTGSSKEWSPFFIFHIVRNKILFIYKNISKKRAFKEMLKICIKNRDRNFKKAILSALKIILTPN